MLKKAPPPVIVETSRTVFVRELTIPAFIGAYDHEFDHKQPVVIDLDLEVVEPATPAADKLENVVCYNRMCTGIREIVDEGHIKLVETLAERIATFALAHPMVNAVRVRVQKPEAISEAAGAGVEIRRRKA
ncbi:MAG: dihydroneopterin aldolase [Pseudomonadota bacterium]